MKKPSLGLYIHIPFCKTICTYCAFLTFAHKNKWIPNYIEALKTEIKGKSPSFKNYQIETIYFGGGTPSLIKPEFIAEVITTLRTNFLFSDKIEISLEANPESIDPNRLKIYHQTGVNRLSLGVQSLNPKTLLKIARPHNEKATLEALKIIRNSPIKNFGCDLIMGLPYQTLAEFKEHLETLLKFKPTHLSAYFLSYDTKRIDTFIKDSPNEEIQIEMYWHLQKRLNKAKFKHYEVSNYALSGYQCRHNLRYWNQQEYLGLGLGAHSYYNQKVTENTRQFDLYLENPLELEETYTLDQEIQRMDYIMLALRQSKGINLKLYSKKFGTKKTSELLKQSSVYSGEFLTTSKSKIAPTDQGFLILDKITKDLI